MLKHLWVNFATKLTLFPPNNSDLQSTLDTLKMEVAEDKLKLSLGISDFKQWMHRNSINADSVVSNPDPLTSLSDIHHVFAHNALVNVRSKARSSAYANARKVNFHFFLGGVMSLIHTSSLSTLGHQPWVISPKLSHISEWANPRKRCRYLTSHLQIVIRTRVICCCSSRLVVRIRTSL